MSLEAPVISPTAAKKARRLLGFGRRETCRRLGITLDTLLRAENESCRWPVSAAVFTRLRTHYEAAGIHFGSEVELRAPSFGTASPQSSARETG